jgi:putative membrane protein
MITVAWIFASIAGGLHIVVFVWEALVFPSPAVHRGIFFTPTEDVPAIRLWAFGVGFYNLFLGLGALIGVSVWMTGNETVGRTLVIYTCLFMFLSGLVLVAADRMEMGRARGKGIGGAIGQGLPPLLALLAVAAA